MTPRQSISASASRTAISLLLLLLSTLGASAQGFLKLQKDTIPFFRGFSLSFDLVGAAQMLLSDHGQYEGAFRLNLHNQYFPIVEAGYGKANHHDDPVTHITYKTSAPYFRIGADVNILKKKHTGNRLYVGLRYGFTSYKVDLNSQPKADPVWKWATSFGVRDEACKQSWVEVVFGLDAKVAGPLHLGWSARYKFRVSHNDGRIGKTWYVPGYGLQDSSALTATFNVIIDI